MTHYFPILKAKQGELAALNNIPLSEKGKFSPLLEIQNYPPLGPDDSTGPLQIQATKLIKSCGSVDALLLDFESAEMNDGDGKFFHAGEFIKSIQSLIFKPEVVPVVSLNSAPEWYRIVADLVDTEVISRVCVRIDQSAIDNLDTNNRSLASEIGSLATMLHVTVSQMILIVDLADIVPMKAFAKMLLTGLDTLGLNALTLACTAAVKDFADFGTGITRVGRKDWALFRDLQSTIPQLDYSDYAVTHPEVFEGDMRFIKPVAKIRYTAADDTIYVKGVATRGPTSPGFSQYASMCQDLLKLSDFSKGLSYGDNFIEACAAGGPSGNLGTWVTVCTNHHIMKVLSQL